MISLLGKTALVTGGSRGIGRAIALALADAGAAVALTYHRRHESADQTVQSIECAGGNAHAVQMTLGQESSVHRAMQEVAQWGSIDILVNNAAMTQEKRFDMLTGSDCQEMLATNLIGPLLCCQTVLPVMQAQRWGRIINIASIGGQWGGTRQVQYAMAKAGLINLTKSLARLYSGEGITINAVSPGLIGTEMVTAELCSKAGQAKVVAIPAGRIGTVEEVAAVVAFLASAEAGYVTGQTIGVNGGQYFG